MRRGKSPIRKPEPLTLSQWSATHFYLSAESSYVEGRWEAYPYQIAIMDLISNDDVREVWWVKSARTGYTKCILAAMAYFAHHKRRNQVVYQPVDDDADEFVKTELDPMIRDVAALKAVFPWADKKSKNNTLRQKGFIGSTLHIRGGKAAKNYRRISVDTVYFDELDGFDIDVDGEGDPITLGAKRAEGAVFPKIVGGSTPKHKMTSLIGWRTRQADVRLTYHVPCPHCGHMQPLRWGGKDSSFGFKWIDADPKTAGHLCEECRALFTQNQYLDVWECGRWMSEDGAYIDDQGLFCNSAGERIATPRSVALHSWTAYSPMATWESIVRDFLAAKDDPAKLKTFVNTTLGEEWEGEIESIDSSTLLERRGTYNAEVPWGAVLLTAGVDVQDDRLEVQVDGWGPNEERWTIDYEVLEGDPGGAQVWDELDEFFSKTYRHESGTELSIWSVCIDTGGHHTQIVYDYCRKRSRRRIYAIKDVPGDGRPLISAPTRKGTARTVKKVALYTVGKWEGNTRIYSSLSISDPSKPRYWHFPNASWCSEEYFEQLTGEVLVTVYRAGFPEKVWKKRRPRQEALSVSIYSLAALNLSSKNHKRLLQKRAAEFDQLRPDEGPPDLPKPPAPRRDDQRAWRDSGPEPEQVQTAQRQSVPGRQRRRRRSSYLGR